MVELYENNGGGWGWLSQPCKSETCVSNTVIDHQSLLFTTWPVVEVRTCSLRSEKAGTRGLLGIPGQPA